MNTLRIRRVLAVLAICACWICRVPNGLAVLANESSVASVPPRASSPDAINSKSPRLQEYYFTHRARGTFELVFYGADGSRDLRTYFISSLPEDDTGAIRFADQESS